MTPPKEKPRELSWYNFDKLYSYDCVQNYIVGSRGEGKTFGAVLRGIRAFLANGEEFIYLRRVQPEIDMSSGSFFHAMERKNMFPDWDFRVTTVDSMRVGQMAPKSSRDDETRPWKTVCYFAVLSKAQEYKSKNFPYVTLIIFDEFIKEKSHSRYLPGNEFETFMGFYATVDRSEDRVKVLFLANSVSIMNPYFLELDIQPDMLPEYSRHEGGYVLVHITDNKDFKGEVSATRMGRFLEGRSFGEYAIGNQFADNHAELILKKPSHARYWMSLETKKGTFSVWRDPDTKRYFIQAKRPKIEVMLTLLAENMSDTKRLVTVNGQALELLRTGFTHGRAYFDKPSTRNAFAEIFKR